MAGSDTVPALPPPPQFGLGFAFAGEDQLQEPDSSGAASIEGTSNDTRQRVAVMVRRLALLLLAAAVGWFLARWLRQFGSHRSGVPVTRDKAEEGLETSLLAFDLDGGDPREQITAAYHRLLAVLDRAEAPRESYEAPHEHLDRVLGPLGIPPAPLHRLAGLYVRAQFSEMPVTEEHRDDAVQALNESLGALCSLATEALEQPRRRSPIGSRT